MTSDLGITCSCCGAHHPDLPMNCTAEAPAVWDPAFADAEDRLLSSDQCVVRAQHYFVKGLIEIPVIGSDEVEIGQIRSVGGRAPRADRGPPQPVGERRARPGRPLRDPLRHFLGDADPDLRHTPTDATAVLGCSCGIWDCRRLFTRITPTPQTVTWSVFRQPHRPAWGDLAMGPYVFPRPVYEEALTHVVHLAEDPLTALPPSGAVRGT
ncbi:DUF2199 domain-containing protein [Streptomyces sp. NBC_01233]|uniref:DUF2199 domain-containing protein n=1 Tax=Streptomyces sp. NBC_01233 TaxID=2903787 RepID=UPI003FA3BBC0